MKTTIKLLDSHIDYYTFIPNQYYTFFSKTRIDYKTFDIKFLKVGGDSLLKFNSYSRIDGFPIFDTIDLCEITSVYTITPTYLKNLEYVTITPLEDNGDMARNDGIFNNQMAYYFGLQWELPESLFCSKLEEMLLDETTFIVDESQLMKRYSVEFEVKISTEHINIFKQWLRHNKCYNEETGEYTPKRDKIGKLIISKYEVRRGRVVEKIICYIVQIIDLIPKKDYYIATFISDYNEVQQISY